MILRVKLTLLLAISIFVSSCEKRQLNVAHVAFEFPEGDSIKVTISNYPLLEEKIVTQLGADSANHSSIRLELSNHSVFYLMINNFRHKLYLKPGYNLKISKDSTQSYAILFEGEGAVLNNYINHISTLLNTQNLIQENFQTFTKKYDSLNGVAQRYTNSYFGRFSLSDVDLDFLRHTTKMQFLLMKVEYGFRAHEAMQTDQAYKYLDGEPAKKIEIPNELKNLFSDIPFDTAYLNDEMFDYKGVLYQYLKDTHISCFEFEFLKSPNQWPKRSNSIIKANSYPPGMKEYLVAADLYYWMEHLTPEIDSLFYEFKSDYPGSIYTSEIQKNYDQMAGLLPGNTAPDFSGRNLEGKLISLKDFKGHVVYVDFWGTWCAPCVEEIPHSKRLQSAFTNKNVIFLNVAAKDTQEAWRRKLAKEKDWLGTHIILDNQEYDTLCKNYRFYGLPQFLLVDQNGKIASVHASRPSSEEVNDEIASLLK